ncbi:MAG TPA: M56 family metallopeptidase [Candidatus Baltobacteraceae bacterium]|nr:M56 family metallopeptidase [Candidatus Baltobacteraceae bacterium]
MSDIGQFLQACVASGIVLSSLCAMVVVPLLLWIAVRRLAPAIVSMNDDPAWQAPIAAFAAALPGLAFGSFAFEALLTGYKSQCLAYVSGRVLFSGIIFLAIAAFVRASMRALQQHAEVRRLFAASVAPSERLARIAGDLGVPVRCLDDDLPLCALAGTTRPTIFISSASERRLNDAELRAALLHERAHRERHDQILIAVLSFATDLLPLPVGDLIGTYRRARELTADRDAARATNPVYVARAILGMARAQSPVLAAGLSCEPSIVRVRLEALLNDRRSSAKSTPRFVIAAILVALTVLASSSAIASVIVSAACARIASM